jgi:hypothetical protein
MFGAVAKSAGEQPLSASSLPEIKLLALRLPSRMVHPFTSVCYRPPLSALKWLVFYTSFRSVQGFHSESEDGFFEFKYVFAPA